MFDRLFLGLFALVSVAGCEVSDVGVSAPISPPPQSIPVAAGTFTELEESVHEKVNQYRQSQGLPTFALDPQMSEIARSHSENMASGQIAFSHDGFEERAEALGELVSLQGVAENVAYNQGYGDPATQAFEGWLESPGHLENIEGDYNLTGIGIAQNSQGEYYFTQLFVRSR
ncbi:CAP domain-containing protein [Oscillatoriales cyanobacterium LEGE 11467]|uniref:CAP domain-containing protein n=1 Tax=Zarconia navalis LEGE 11467 TaxID=1828826 RepID=A0A928VXE8_9CYAN|nr:CAP domain-containing protein [Zarconia navalis]MBE9041369.1 CAP domain-containing protein [Zarconia navalis LEGE 11467]